VKASTASTKLVAAAITAPAIVSTQVAVAGGNVLEIRDAPAPRMAAASSGR